MCKQGSACDELAVLLVLRLQCSQTETCYRERERESVCVTGFPNIRSFNTSSLSPSQIKGLCDTHSFSLPLVCIHARVQECIYIYIYICVCVCMCVHACVSVCTQLNKPSVHNNSLMRTTATLSHIIVTLHGKSEMSQSIMYSNHQHPCSFSI